MANDAFQELLADLSSSTNPAQKAAVAAESVLGDLPEAVAVVARRCVILHWFDEPVIAALMPENEQPDPADIYQQLENLPFIETVPWGLAYHDLTRQGLLERYVSSQPELLRAAAELAAPVYEGREDDETAAAEAFYCYTVAGQAEAALELLDKLLVEAVRRADWRRFGALFQIQDEAESYSFVSPLKRAAIHWVARGLARRQQGDLPGAIADYDRAIELEPDDATAYTNRGLARYDQKDLPGAIADYDRAIELNPDDATAYTNRGNARRQQGDLPGAIADYDRAIELKPEYATAYTNRGLARRLKGDASGAVSDAETVRKLEPDNVSRLVNLVGAYMEAGQTEQGAELARDVLSRLPETDYYNRGCIEALLGQTEVALDLLEKSLEEGPANKDWAQRDPDWQSLRSHPRYRRLVGLPGEGEA
jgi:tetratricopeptide (TPR) repeat protein